MSSLLVAPVLLVAAVVLVLALVAGFVWLVRTADGRAEGEARFGAPHGVDEGTGTEHRHVTTFFAAGSDGGGGAG